MIEFISKEPINKKKNIKNVTTKNETTHDIEVIIFAFLPLAILIIIAIMQNTAKRTQTVSQDKLLFDK